MTVHVLTLLNNLITMLCEYHHSLYAGVNSTILPFFETHYSWYMFDIELSANLSSFWNI